MQHCTLPARPSACYVCPSYQIDDYCAECNEPQPVLQHCFARASGGVDKSLLKASITAKSPTCWGKHVSIILVVRFKYITLQ